MLAARDPFADDVLERLVKSNQDYQRAHGHYIVPLAERLLKTRAYLTEIKKLASDPFASDAVALRACLLAAYEALGLPGPQPSPERDIARAIIKDARST
jgi:hypothetical protein